MSNNAILEAANRLLRGRIGVLEAQVNDLQDKTTELLLLMTDDQIIELGGGIEKCKEAAEELRLRFRLAIDKAHKSKKPLEQNEQEA